MVCLMVSLSSSCFRPTEIVVVIVLVFRVRILLLLDVVLVPDGLSHGLSLILLFLVLLPPLPLCLLDGLLSEALLLHLLLLSLTTVLISTATSYPRNTVSDRPKRVHHL